MAVATTGRGGFSSVNSGLAGAQRINAMHFNAARDDLGGKVAWLISAVLALNTAVSALNAGAVSAAGSGVTWSAFSTAPTSSLAAISNFSAR